MEPQWNPIQAHSSLKVSQEIPLALTIKFCTSICKVAFCQPKSKQHHHPQLTETHTHTNRTQNQNSRTPEKPSKTPQNHQQNPTENTKQPLAHPTQTQLQSHTTPTTSHTTLEKSQQSLTKSQKWANPQLILTKPSKSLTKTHTNLTKSHQNLEKTQKWGKQPARYQLENGIPFFCEWACRHLVFDPKCLSQKEVPGRHPLTASSIQRVRTCKYQ